MVIIHFFKVNLNAFKVDIQLNSNNIIIATMEIEENIRHTLDALKS